MPVVPNLNPVSFAPTGRSGRHGVTKVRKFLLIFMISSMALLCTAPAWAERNFPQTAMRGDMKAFEYPAMKIGERAYRLSPGSRIYNRQNLIIMPVAVQNTPTPIMYMLDTRGDLSQVWLLTPTEALLHPPTSEPIPVNPPPSR